MSILAVTIALVVGLILIIINFKIKETKVARAVENTGILDALGESVAEMGKDAKAARAWLQKMEAKHGPFVPVQPSLFEDANNRDPGHDFLLGNAYYDRKNH